MITTVIKRDGREVPFDSRYIYKAIFAAITTTWKRPTNDMDCSRVALDIADDVANNLNNAIADDFVTVEQIQDYVEKELIKINMAEVAKNYILYRDARNRIRERKSTIMTTIREIVTDSKQTSDLKRENANINSDAPMGMMLKYGTETSKEFALTELLDPVYATMHREGKIHIHDLDFYSTGTLTCVQIDLLQLFHDGFSTGHGYLREPNSIRSYAALACIAIQSSQNDFHL